MYIYICVCVCTCMHNIYSMYIYIYTHTFLCVCVRDRNLASLRLRKVMPSNAKGLKKDSISVAASVTYRNKKPQQNKSEWYYVAL